MNNLKGLYSALITPFSADESLNLDSLRTLIEQEILAGVDGLFVAGTTGESFLLSEMEYRQIVSVSVETSAARVPVVANVAAMSTAGAIGRAEFAEQCGASAIGLLPPIYFRYGERQIIDFYKDVCAACKLPVIAYDIPSCTGIELLRDAYAEIFSLPQIMGLKASCQEFSLLNTFKRRHPQKKVFLGVDECFVPGFAFGFDGAIGSTFNIMIKQFRAVYDAVQRGDLSFALRMQNICNDFIEVLVQCGVTPSIKFLLQESGLNCGECRRPFKRLNIEEKNRLSVSYAAFCDRAADLMRTDNILAEVFR